MLGVTRCPCCVCNVFYVLTASVELCLSVNFSPEGFVLAVLAYFSVCAFAQWSLFVGR